jgi:hypothetical protein
MNKSENHIQYVLIIHILHIRILILPGVIIHHIAGMGWWNICGICNGVDVWNVVRGT